ncbi:DUF4129 domain-containing protein [Halomarina rubra]|uniref:DUF4129 domain-containing protein n=1 Tax=Halomarina rubra TaxID=2071873 RepID=A0ABD6AVB8_9EURY
MYAPRRAALLALCAIAVILAASLFPAVGFGSYPSGSWTGPAGDAAVSGPADGQPADVEDPTDDPNGQSDENAPGEPTPTPTATPTATPTETPAAADSGGDRHDGSGGESLLLVPVLAVFGGLFLVLGLSLRRLGYRRRGFWFVHPSLPDLPPAFVRNALAAIPQATMGFVVGVGATLPRLLDDTATVLGAAGSAVVNVGRGAARAMALTLTAVPTAFAAGLGGIATGFGRALGALPGAASSLGGQTIRDGSTTDATTTTEEESLAEDLGPLSVEEAWAEMTDRVPIRNRNAATPGQYARRAVRRGLPARSVGTLTRLFREVRYGGRSGEERFGDALDAYDALDEDDEDGGDDA